jgi:hypothetical protein
MVIGSSDVVAGVVAATPQWHRYPRSWGAAAELIAAGTSPILETTLTSRLRARVFDYCAPKMFRVLCRTFDALMIVNDSSSAGVPHSAAGRVLHFADVDIPIFDDASRHVQFLRLLAGNRGDSAECGVAGIHALSARSLTDQTIVDVLCAAIRRNTTTLRSFKLQNESFSTSRGMMRSLFMALETCSRLTALCVSSWPADCELPLNWPPLAALHTLRGVTMGLSGVTFQRLADEAPCLRELDLVWVGRLHEVVQGAPGFIEVTSRLEQLSILDQRSPARNFFRFPHQQRQRAAPAALPEPQWPESLPLLRHFSWRTAYDGEVGVHLGELIWRAPNLRSLTAPPSALLPIRDSPDAANATAALRGESGRASSMPDLLQALRTLRFGEGPVTDRVLRAALYYAPRLMLLDLGASGVHATALGGFGIHGDAVAVSRPPPHGHVRHVVLGASIAGSQPVLVSDDTPLDSTATGAEATGGVRVSEATEGKLRALFPRLRSVTSLFENRKTQVMLDTLKNEHA